VRPSSRTTFALIATVVVVGSVMAVIWLIHSSRHPVDTGTVYAGYLAAVAIAVTLLMAIGGWWWKGRQMAGAKSWGCGWGEILGGQDVEGMVQATAHDHVVQA
jgi:hypothetical protein